MSAGGALARSPWTFFVLVLALGVPFAVAGALSGAQLPVHLPVSALQFVVPLVVAIVLVALCGDGADVRRLLGRVFDWSRIRPRAWYVPVALLMPAVTALSYWLMDLAGRPLADLRVSVFAVLLSCVMYVFAAACEEVGWSGYATDPLRQQWGTLGTGLVIGVVWACWHIVPWLQVRSPSWVVWQFLFTVAACVLIVWLYVSAGRSVFAATLCHASINVSYSLFPSQYDPAFVAPITMLVAVAVTAMPGAWRRARGRQQWCDAAA